MLNITTIENEPTLCLLETTKFSKPFFWNIALPNLNCSFHTSEITPQSLKAFCFINLPYFQNTSLIGLPWYSNRTRNNLSKLFIKLRILCSHQKGAKLLRMPTAIVSNFPTKFQEGKTYCKEVITTYSIWAAPIVLLLLILSNIGYIK